MKFLYSKILVMFLVMMGTLSSWAQTYDGQAAIFTWAVGNESEAALSDGIADAVSQTSVSVGTDLSVTSTSATYTMGEEGTYGPYCTYLPATTNAGCVSTDMIEYTIQLKKGLTFNPTSVSMDAVKEGTDNAYFSWSYTVDGVEGSIVAYDDPKTQIRRNNNANPSAPITHTEAISATGGQKVTFRVYISNVANNKKMSVGNIKVSGTISGTVAARAFKAFEIGLTKNPVGDLPEGVTQVSYPDHGCSYNGSSHGWMWYAIQFAVDGPVKITLGGCQYINTGCEAYVTDGTNTLATIDNKGCGCYHNGGTASWIYNSETPATLTVYCGQYCPYVKVEPCDLIPMRTVTYYDVDGKTVIGQEEVAGGSALAYKYSATDVTVAEGSVFRGWFNSTQASAVKVAEGTSVQDNLSLYAKATPVEVATVGSIFNYPLNSTSFYIEDHECITSTGVFHDSQHGYVLYADQSISIPTAGNAVINIGICKYSKSDATLTVTDANGAQVGEALSAYNETDGSAVTIKYEGAPTTLTITASKESYIHNVTVYNVENIPAKNASGYYELAANDGASLQLVLAALEAGDKIYLPNGTYDFGEKALTTISANNVSIVGESMDGTIIRNCPPKENEGIGTTATLLNTSENLYLQDLTIQNALDYYATGSAGRAVCLQDKGANTICKNVKMLSYQDTYYSNKASNFYWEDSEIHGTVDYLCGDGNVVYNRVKLVNESREKTAGKGDCTICAPYNTATSDDRYNWGYVFLNCTVETKSASFNLGRSWGGESKATYINTTVLEPSKLASSRFTAKGMNIAASAFKEYNTLDKDGNVISPKSNVMTFTHSTGDKTYETILSAAEAAEFTLEKIYGTWAPDQTAAQVTDPAKGSVYLVNGQITTTLPSSGKCRIANGRGGFGPEVAIPSEVKIEDVKNASSVESTVYNLSGQRVKAGTKGLVIKNNQKVLVK